MRAAAMQVEVMYARPESIWRRSVSVPERATLREALDASGFFRDFPEFIDDAALAVGVFGRLCGMQQTLHAGDRVEVYRPLAYDPMESRRRRARHRQRKAATGGGKEKLSET